MLQSDIGPKRQPWAAFLDQQNQVRRLFRGVGAKLGFMDGLIEQLDGAGAMSLKFAFGLSHVPSRLPHVIESCHNVWMQRWRGCRRRRCLRARSREHEHEEKNYRQQRGCDSKSLHDVSFSSVFGPGRSRSSL
jgi:hypothetical protein